MKIDHSKFYSIYLLYIINGLGFSLLIPVFPFLIQMYHQSAITLGVIASGFSFFQMFGANVLWTLSDKFGRKPILIVTQIGTFLSWIILWSAYFFPDIQILNLFSLPIAIVFLARIVDGITGGNISVAQAYVGDISTREERSIIFGYLGALSGFMMIIGSSLWAFAMSTKYSYVGTAILWACVSLCALCFMIFQLKESLSPELKQAHLQFHLSQLNIFSWIKKWIQIDVYKPIFLFKFFVMTAFSMHTTIFTLYLVDMFHFNILHIGYYLLVTGSFLIVNQIFFAKMIIKKIGDFRSLWLGGLLFAIGFMSMSLSGNIFMFTAVYFFVNLGFSLVFSTMQGLISRNAWVKSQGEIMGLSSSTDAFIYIYSPLLGSFLYQLNHKYIYAEISIFIIFALWLMLLFFRQYFFPKK